MLKKRLLVLAVMLLLLVVVATKPVSADVFCSCAMVCGGGGAACQLDCSGSGSAGDYIRAAAACCSEAGRVTPIQCND